MAESAQIHRRPRVAVAAAFLAVAFTACSGGGGGDTAPVSDRPQRGGQAVVGFTADISGVNTLIVPLNTPTSEVARHLFVQLLREQPARPDAPPTFTPDLARSYEWSDGHKTLTFHLRDDVRWSDGEPVTADDVLFSWQAQTSPEVAWDSAYEKEFIEKVEVIDPYTVRFRFHHAYSTQLLDANEDYILPRHVWGQVPFAQWRSRSEWFRDHLVTAGPFLLASWKPQQEIVLARNPDYYDPELPRLDRVVIRIIPDQSSHLTQLLSGGLDYSIALSPDDAGRVRAAPDVELISFWGRAFIFVGWNERLPLFADRDVRRALTLGIDRATIAKSLWGEFGRVATSPIVGGVWGHDDAIQPYPYDPDQARAILRAKGWADHDGDGVLDRDGKPLAFELATNAGNRQRIDATVMIQDQLKRIGVAVTPQILEFQALSARVDAGRYEAQLAGWVMPTTLDLSYAFHSREIDGGSNVVAFSDPELDGVLDQIRATPELTEARPLLFRAQEIIHQELPYTFLWESQRLVGVNRRIHGAKPNSLFLLHNLPEWWVGPARH
jgi:peptide/nickel transport system substrate-binding protein